MKIVISQRGIYGNLMLSPGSSFGIPNLPIFRILAGVNNVATDGYERRLFIVNGLHQSLPDDGIRRFRIRGIVKSRIAKRNESKWTGHIQRERLVI